MLSTAFSLLLQFAFFTLAMAAPITTQENAWAYGSGGGIIGLIVLVLDIIVALEVLKSSKPPVHKVLWLLLVFLFPIGGLIIFYLFADRSTSGGSYEPIA